MSATWWLGAVFHLQALATEAVVCWLQVCTLWQGAVILVQAFPLFPDMVAVAHAIAEDAGEPSAAAIHAAALADPNAMQGKEHQYLRASACLHDMLICACVLLWLQKDLTAQKQLTACW